MDYFYYYSVKEIYFISYITLLFKIVLNILNLKKHINIYCIGVPARVVDVQSLSGPVKIRLLE